MSVSPRLLRLLDRHQAKYEVLPHRTVYTAFDLATTLAVEVRTVAKALLIRADRQYVLAVVPAHMRVDCAKLGKLLRATKVAIAPEAAIRKLRVIPGTTPPFGSLVGVPVVMDHSLTKMRSIVVRAGSLTDSLRVTVRDVVRMESPTVGAFATRMQLPSASRATPARRTAPKRKSPRTVRRPAARRSARPSAR